MKKRQVVVVSKINSSVTPSAKIRSLFLGVLFSFSGKVAMHAWRNCVLLEGTGQPVSTCIRQYLREFLCAIPGQSGSGYLSCSVQFPK